MRAFGAIVIAGLALLQAGCATMNQDECLTGDWALVGYQDGSNGYPPSYLDKHAKACAAHGVRPDAATYLDARERGLFEYCTPPRGFREGRMGRKYHGVCPPSTVPDFLAGYDDGLRVNAAEEHRDDIRRDVRRFEQRIDDIDEELDGIADRLGESGLDKDTRESLEDTRRHLRRELRDAQAGHDRAWRLEQAADDHATRLRIDLSRYYGDR
ncbi:MAG: DUF2799 domain-containing protein [Luteimonas sp.]|nr:DUF2799 domain-containing protein [Luteimonas sp.]